MNQENKYDIDTDCIKHFIKQIVYCGLCESYNTEPLARQCCNDMCNSIICCSCYTKLLSQSGYNSIKCPYCRVNGVWEFTGKLINTAAAQQIVDCNYCSQSMSLIDMEDHVIECHTAT